MTPDVLERRLRDWAEEYRGGRYEHLGFSGRNILSTLIEHRGFVPSSRGFVPVPTCTPADEVEVVVNRMAEVGLYPESHVLRIEYFEPDLATEHRLDRLRRLGLAMTEDAYASRLAMAKGFLMGALSSKPVARSGTRTSED